MSLTDQLGAIVFGLANLTIDIPILDVSVPVLEVLHAILINYAYRSMLRGNHAHIGWGQGLLATIVMCAGGGSTVAILRGEPLGILKSNRFWGIYGTTYWLMFSNPYFYNILQFLFSIPVVEQVVCLSDGILRNFAVTRIGVDGVSANPALGEDKWVAKIICGTLAGSGGGLWIDAFRLTHQEWSFSTPRLLHTASIDMKASFLTAVFYVISTTPELSEWIGIPGLKPVEAQAWSAVIMSSGLVYKSLINRMNAQKPQANTEESKKDQ
ncbi:uncharacterized protein BYT42DRAFT_561002 [Radiomyces spectabilis]|uniref:uncharacterized protein n=1 Tax=Radiomyces spectabilis TaxID=64574 RepID=UPI0022207A78|nr:uncharacterized protein BYT42DRAFT_561002 [Radiomyces spectabilis]KAI8388723.1 hypothetical protein BYT42DRAFT_561002 [Radiomyces spectabilis]